MTLGLPKCLNYRWCIDTTRRDAVTVQRFRYTTQQINPLWLTQHELLTGL